MTIDKVSYTQFKRGQSDLIIQARGPDMKKPKKTSTSDRDAIPFRICRVKYFLPLVVGVVIAICSGAGFAQATASKSLPQQSDTAAT